MSVRNGREAPSVASTRVLRTHRKNSVENFRLQERVKTIDHESQHNCSQILDEIDGLRQHLVKIKGVKKNVGVSEERRKLLRDKGLRILPSKQKSDEDYFTVRTSEGKDFTISCVEFYDSNAMRKRIRIDLREAATTPCLVAENSDSEEPIDFMSGESRGRHNTIAEGGKEFRYRNITPPLRPGSRRNFKDIEEKNPEDEEKNLLENISGTERKYGILRPQTAHLKRERQVLLRPRNRTCPADLQNNEAARTLERKLSRKSSGDVGNSRKNSRFSSSVASETNTLSDKSTKQPVQSDSKVCYDNVVLEQPISLSPCARPTISPRSVTAGGRLSSSGVSSTTEHSFLKLEDWLDTNKHIQLPPTPSGGKWSQQASSPESSPRIPRESVVTLHEDSENMERKLSKPRNTVLSVNEDHEKIEGNFCKLSERKVSWKDKVQDNGNNYFVKNSLSNASQPSNGLYTDRAGRSGSLLNNLSHYGRVQSAPQPRPSIARYQSLSPRNVSKIDGKRSSQDFVYDARPDKALSKGYVTMQMTIGNKQVKVYVPKFSTAEFVDDVVERARAKSAVKASVSLSRPLPGSKR